MPRYAVHLEVRTDRPLTQQQINQLDDGRHDLHADGQPRTSSLTVSLKMAGSDVAGALARSLNLVLDHVPGDGRHADVTQLRQQPAPPRRGR